MKKGKFNYAAQIYSFINEQGCPQELGPCIENIERYGVFSKETKNVYMSAKGAFYAELNSKRPTMAYVKVDGKRKIATDVMIVEYNLEHTAKAATVRQFRGVSSKLFTKGNVKKKNDIKKYNRAQRRNETAGYYAFRELEVRTYPFATGEELGQIIHDKYNIGSDYQAATRYINDFVLKYHDLKMTPAVCFLVWVDKQATLDNPECPSTVRDILQSSTKDFYTIPYRVDRLGIVATTRHKVEHSRG